MNKSNGQLKDMLNALGAAAEMGLTVYKAALGAGATDREAFIITQAYFSACMYGKPDDGEAD